MAMADLQKIDISSRTILRVVIILAAAWFIYVIRDVLMMLFAAIIIAAAIEPVADRLQRRRIPRAVTVLGVYVVFLLIFSAVVTLLIPPLTAQVRQLAESLPHLVQLLKDWRLLSPAIGDAVAVQSIQDLLLRFGENLTNVGVSVVEQTRNIFSGVFSTLFVFILAFYLVIENDALLKILRLIIPREHFPYVERTVNRIQRGLGRWLLAQLALAVVVGVVVGLGLWLIGVKYALLLGLLAGLFEIIPVIGPIMAAIPGVVVALSQSVVIGVIAIAFYVLVQQLENHLLVPNIMRRAAGLNPLVTLVAILLGARLAGVVGIMLAVPVAIIITIFWSDLFLTESLEMEAPPEH
jgi:predicted PurR-regulated permease PerM